MAFDGITVAGLTAEFNECLLDGRIYKIAQPEPDELLITIRSAQGQYRLLLSANASLPLACFTDDNRISPVNAPNFCMLLRKHIQNGRIRSISQPGLERCIRFEIEHLDELGDPAVKVLVIELMGKHSNIIFCDINNMIIDSIKHISGAISSIREVLPGRPYFLPNISDKIDPLSVSPSEVRVALSKSNLPLSKAIYTVYCGLSPLAAEEICYRSSIDSSKTPSDLTDSEWVILGHIFANLMDDINLGKFAPVIYLKDGEPAEFSAVPLQMYNDCSIRVCSSVSAMICDYYSSKEASTRIRQKSADLRHIVQTALERDSRKYDLQANQLKDTEKRDKYRVYGELINAYGYSLPAGSSLLTAHDHYSGKTIDIPLDSHKTISENAQRCFERYNKLKRTFEALTIQLKDTKADISYLESVAASLDMARTEADLAEIREELCGSGYIRSHAAAKRRRETSKPLHYISSDGYDIYVGKNNIQNEMLTFKTAQGCDWWFHAKEAPGSHVIVKSGGDAALPDTTYEEAARLAAHYSRASKATKAEVDYVEKKHVKKANGGRPGFVIYHTNYSMTVPTDISNIHQAE